MAKDVLITPASGKLEVKASNGTTVETKIEDGNIVLTGTLSASGYNDSNWNTGYGWGNHASAGYATESYVGTQIANLIASAPGTLDTLNELAEALNDDPNFATTVTNSIATKLPLAGGRIIGNMIIAHDASNPAGFSSSSDLAIFGSHQSTGTLFEVFNSADTSVLKILGSGNLSIHGTITASGYNDSNWNTAYTHSQQAHAPSNAEQNVNADWSSGSGDSEILNKPNVCLLYTSPSPRDRG